MKTFTAREIEDIVGSARNAGRIEEADLIEYLFSLSKNEWPPQDRDLPQGASRKQPPLLTSTQAGEMLGVSAQTVKNWVNDGKLFGYRIGNRVMIPRTVIELYLRGAAIRPGANARIDEEWELSDDEAAEAVRHDRNS
jgi:excisionase family DNA binding protein